MDANSQAELDHFTSVLVQGGRQAWQEDGQCYNCRNTGEVEGHTCPCCDGLSANKEE